MSLTIGGVLSVCVSVLESGCALSSQVAVIDKASSKGIDGQAVYDFYVKRVQELSN